MARSGCLVGQQCPSHSTHELLRLWTVDAAEAGDGAAADGALVQLAGADGCGGRYGFSPQLYLLVRINTAVAGTSTMVPKCRYMRSTNSAAVAADEMASARPTLRRQPGQPAHGSSVATGCAETTRRLSSPPWQQWTFGWFEHRFDTATFPTEA